jgi:hypothetical protein
VAFAVASLVGPSVVESFDWPPLAPALQPPPPDAIHVYSESALQTALAALETGQAIVLHPEGSPYALTNTLWVGGVDNVTFRGSTGDPDDVVIVGRGMANSNYGNVPHVFHLNHSDHITIADLTLRDVYFHLIQLHRSDDVLLHNLRLVDAGEQHIKGSTEDDRDGADRGVLEYSTMEFTTTGRWWYVNGIDIHAGADWIIRYNLFRNIRSGDDQLAGPALHMWNESSGTIVESNFFLNCERGIALGLIDRPGYNDHSGGVIRNNFFYRAADEPGDVGIHVADSPSTRIINNTVILSGTYYAAIEYRYPASTGTYIANNLSDAVIWDRDGATGTVESNVTDALPSLFENLAAGDPRLAASATTAIDQGLSLTDCTTDFEGDLRPQGAAPDIGADEYQISRIMVDGFESGNAAAWSFHTP